MGISLITIQFILTIVTKSTANLEYVGFDSKLSFHNQIIPTTGSENEPGLTTVPIKGIDSLTIGQKYFINVKSVGCFHHSNLYLTISRKGDGYYADFKMKGKIEGQKVKRTFKTMKLSESKIDSIRGFERKLIEVSAETYNCTTIDTYNLTIGVTKHIYKTDNCDWQGIGKLVGVLFKKQE